jgi:hypothetical protein
MSTDYDRDFYAWAMENAALLRQGRPDRADLANIAEELESIGKSERRELFSRMRVLVGHLLKWQCQPDQRSSDWRGTIGEQRNAIEDVLADSPSLRGRVAAALAEAYPKARRLAALETGLPLGRFPESCPYRADQVLPTDFWPDDDP